MTKLQSILVPTDFSSNSENAVNYGVDLAATCGAKLVLLHVYQVPVQLSENPIPLISISELEDANRAALEKYRKKIVSKYPSIEISIVLKLGFVVDEILEAANENKVDLIVMGITGVGAGLNSLIGSSTATVLKKSKTPILVIPANSKFKKIENIALAFDYKNNIASDALMQVKKYSQLFGAKVVALNVFKPEAVPTVEEAAMGINVKNSLGTIDCDFKYLQSEDVVEELNQFVDSYQCDWLVMFPHNYNLFEGLFHKSSTKQMAYHTHIPLLSIHQ
ncbi:MAG: universal stress protein [Bacteroidetes bacterium]|nr:universal stress protein [Bacteroidota bacterium]